MLSLTQTLQIIKNTKDFHAALVRNQFRVPELKSPICTKEFLIEVREGKVFVPKIHELKLASCTEPPTIQMIQEELIRVIEAGLAQTPLNMQPKFARFVYHLRKRPADK